MERSPFRRGAGNRGRTCTPEVPDPKGSVTLVKDFLLAQHHAYVLNFTGYYACETKEIATRDYGLTYGSYYKLSKIVFNA